MEQKRVGFIAGLAGGFGFYIAWMILVMLWQTTTTADAAMKSVIGLALGLAVGVLLYYGTQVLLNRKREATASKRITRYTIWGVVAGLAVAFLFGLTFYNPVELWMPLQGVFGKPPAMP